MSDPVEDYLREWRAIHEKARNILAGTSVEAMIAATQQAMPPFYYWLERHDTEYMEGGDPDFVPASEYTGGEDSPQSTLSTPPPSSPSGRVKVSVTGSRSDTIAAKEDLKSDWHLRWSGSPAYVWEGEIESKNLVAFKKWCDERKLVLHKED